MILTVRTVAALLVLIGFSVASLGRFADFVYAQRTLDVVSRVDNATAAARLRLLADLAPGAPVGCLNLHPQGTIGCELVWYALLPFYARTISSGDRSYMYVVMIANPTAADSPAVQAAAIPGYAVHLDLGEGLYLLRRTG